MKNGPAQLLREAIRTFRPTGKPAGDEPTPSSETDQTAVTIADAALRQFELFGLSRATIEDVARRARVGRVTVYRHFPGKDTLIQAVALRELRKFLSDLDEAVAPLEDAEARIEEGFVFTLHAAREHRLLQRLIESEPETALPWLTVKGAPIVAAATEFMAGNLARDFDDDRGGPELLHTAEIVVRLLLSFVLTPRVNIDLEDDEAAREFARLYLRPMLAAPDGTLNLEKDRST